MKKWYDEKHNLTIVYMNLPVGVDEAITINEDCSYTAVIAENQCQEKQYKAYLHAVDHIENDDFENGKDVQQIERRCHHPKP